MLPTWIIAELERRRRQGEREAEERPRLEVEDPRDPARAPAPRTPTGPIVIELG